MSTGRNSSDPPFIVVIGGANIDIHGRPASELRMHDSNPGTVRSSPGGVGRNIAENLARLGADCRLVTVIGDDQHGELLLKHGRDAGIDMRYVTQIDSRETSAYVSVLDPAGDMHVAVSDMRIIDELGPAQLQAHEAMLDQAAIIVIDTNLNDGTLAYVAATFSDRPIFADTVSTTKAMRIEPHLHAVHTLKPSLLEAEALAGFKARTDKQLPKLAEWFHERRVVRLFITLGERGVFYSTGEAQGIEAPGTGAKAMSNAGGAGDAFMAGLAYAWLHQWNLDKTLDFSLAAAQVTLADTETSSRGLSLAAVNRLTGNAG